MYYTYILRCADNSLYTGITTNPERRFLQHCGKKSGGAKYTASHPPIRMEAVWHAPNHPAAARLEYQIKTLTKQQKEQMITGIIPTKLSMNSFIRIKINENGGKIPMLFVCYPKCSTCKKAQNWLNEHEISYTVRDIKEDHPTEQELRVWHAKSGLPLKRFFNTSGQLYRAMELSKKLPNMSEDEQFSVLASDGMLVKRPIVVADDFVVVGFKPNEWEEKF